MPSSVLLKATWPPHLAQEGWSPYAFHALMWIGPIPVRFLPSLSMWKITRFIRICFTWSRMENAHPLSQEIKTCEAVSLSCKCHGEVMWQSHTNSDGPRR